MRVTHVITRLIVGGAQENTIASVLGLRRRHGLDVDLVAGPTTGAEGSLEEPLRREPGLLTIEPRLIRPIRPASDWLAYRGLLRHFQRRRPLIVHTHSGKAGFLGRLAARRAGVPLIIHSIHGPSFGSFQGSFANFVFKSAERLAGRFTDHFVVVAEAMTHQYLASGIGEPSRYSRIFSGFPLEPFLNARRDPQLAQHLGIGPDDIVVGMTARLFELKGHAELFAVAPELVRRHGKLRFLLIGDGGLRESLEARAASPGLKGRFIFAGLVPPTEVPRYVALMDMLVHLSRREGLARALPQAMATGVPVVASDIDGAREVCLDGRTGYLIPPGDDATLVRRMIELAESRELRTRLGEAGREFVRARFSVETLVDEQQALYVRLSRERGLAKTGAGPGCSAPGAEVPRA